MMRSIFIDREDINWREIVINRKSKPSENTLSTHDIYCNNNPLHNQQSAESHTGLPY